MYKIRTVIGEREDLYLLKRMVEQEVAMPKNLWIQGVSPISETY
jgi:hypothetical protein